MKTCAIKLLHAIDWIIDYFHMIISGFIIILSRRPPNHYLGIIKQNKRPIVLAPGVNGHWSNFKRIVNHLSMEGHPIYIVPKANNSNLIKDEAENMWKFVLENNLHNIVILAHSKGGLVSKYMMVHFDHEDRISKLISIATPYHGTKLARYFPQKHMKELTDISETINDLNIHNEKNNLIYSIMPVYDNHVWHEQASNLERATNIVLPVKGHHKVLFNKQVIQQVENCL